MMMKTAGGGRCEKKTLKAINAGKKISFSYFQYNGRKQQKLKNSGAEYVCSPWTPVWNERERSGTTDKEALL